MSSSVANTRRRDEQSRDNVEVSKRRFGQRQLSDSLAGWLAGWVLQHAEVRIWLPPKFGTGDDEQKLKARVSQAAG